MIVEIKKIGTEGSELETDDLNGSRPRDENIDDEGPVNSPQNKNKSETKV